MPDIVLPALPPISTEQLLERFLRYVSIDTTADPGAESFPSNPNEVALAELLAAELRDLGLADASVDAFGYVIATLPGNRPAPPIGLVAHLDTAPDAPGAGIRPILHRNYQGQALFLPGAPEQELSPATCPALAGAFGEDLVTSDGTTLLGADDKAGIAVIMSALDALAGQPDWPHGDLRIVFTPDEEVGNGTRHLDLARLGLKFAYTVDGGAAPEFNEETFEAANATIRVTGRNVHPGKAKGILINAVEVVGDLIARLPKDLTPQATSDRQGFIHATAIAGGVEQARLDLILRDFEPAGLARLENILLELVETIRGRHPGAGVELEVRPAYPNMKAYLASEPRVSAFALEALAEAGLEPWIVPIRGGTDGAMLSRAGVLTPNLFTGSGNHHSRLEWASVQQMAKATEVVLRLVRRWAAIAAG